MILEVRLAMGALLEEVQIIGDICNVLVSSRN